MSVAGSSAEWDFDARDGSVVRGPPGLSGRGQDPYAWLLRNGDVGPPVQRFGLGVRVADADESKQQRTVGRHQQVDREHQISGAFPLPDPQCSATAGRHAAREDRSARRGRVSGGAEVPLDAAGEPGVGEREVGELQAPVGEHQIPVGRQVAERPEPAPEARKHQRLQPTIRYPERRDIPRPQVAANSRSATRTAADWPAGRTRCARACRVAGSQTLTGQEAAAAR